MKDTLALSVTIVQQLVQQSHQLLALLELIETKLVLIALTNAGCVLKVIIVMKVHLPTHLVMQATIALKDQPSKSHVNLELTVQPCQANHKFVHKDISAQALEQTFTRNAEMVHTVEQAKHLKPTVLMVISEQV